MGRACEQGSASSVIWDSTSEWLLMALGLTLCNYARAVAFKYYYYAVSPQTLGMWLCFTI